MSQIKAKVVADSLGLYQDRLTSIEVEFPRIILAELNTHRMLSKNSASSRAIPFNKMVENVRLNTFIPIAFQKEHKGMQGSEYFIGEEALTREDHWLVASMDAINAAKSLNHIGITKQICNRILEPFMMHKVLISGTEWENFFSLRCPQYYFGDNGPYRSRKDLLKVYTNSNMDYATEVQWLMCNKGQAEIHMMALAEAVWDAMNESIPKQLKEGEWHIPYQDKMTPYYKQYKDAIAGDTTVILNPDIWPEEIWPFIKTSVGMCARTSYSPVGDEKEVSYETLIGIHDKMLNQVPFHASPFEHIAQVPTSEDYFINVRGKGSYPYNQERGEIIMPALSEGWFRNYRGFKQYRQILEDERSN